MSFAGRAYAQARPLPNCRQAQASCRSAAPYVWRRINRSRHGTSNSLRDRPYSRNYAGRCKPHSAGALVSSRITRQSATEILEFSLLSAGKRILRASFLDQERALADS